MSIKNLWQICHRKGLDNAMLTNIIIVTFKANKLTTKELALELDIKTERVRNWYYRNTGMTALDLLKILHSYEFYDYPLLSGKNEMSLKHIPKVLT